MIFLDAAVRFSSIGLLIMLALMSIKLAKNSLPHMFLLLACISLAGLFLGYTPGVFDLPDPIKIPFRILDIPHLIFIWLFSLSLFEKDFSIQPWHWFVGTIYCLPIAAARLFQFTDLGLFPFWATALVGVMSFAIAGHMIINALSGRADDLSSSRRVSRIYFSLLIAFVTISAAGIELIFIDAWAVYLPTAKVLTIWPAIFWVVVWLVQLRPNAFAFGPGKESLDNSQPQSRLDMALTEEIIGRSAYLEQGISIPLLAKRLGVSQHALREFINKELGFKNFSDFINTYRIDAVKHAFADPANRHRSILDIAMSYGFNSLSPFNKAFKKHVQLTPSQFREKLEE